MAGDITSQEVQQEEIRSAPAGEATPDAAAAAAPDDAPAATEDTAAVVTEAAAEIATPAGENSAEVETAPEQEEPVSIEEATAAAPPAAAAAAAGSSMRESVSIDPQSGRVMSAPAARAGRVPPGGHSTLSLW